MAESLIMALVSIAFVLAVSFGALAAADLVSRVHLVVASIVRTRRQRLHNAQGRNV